MACISKGMAVAVPFFVSYFCRCTKNTLSLVYQKAKIMTWLDEFLEEDAVTTLLKHLNEDFTHDGVKYIFRGIRFREDVPLCVVGNYDTLQVDYLDPYLVYGYLCM